MELSHPGCLLLQFYALNHVFNHIYAEIIAYGFKILHKYVFKYSLLQYLHINKEYELFTS